MERKMKGFRMVLISMILVFIAGVQTAMAAKLGADYAVGGIELGWVLIGLALLIFILGWAKVISTAMFKKFASIAIVLLVAGIALSFVDVEDVDEGQIDTVTGATFDIDPGGYCSTKGSESWDDAETTFTIPLEITGSNELDGNKSSVNFTITPNYPLGAETTNLAECYFKTDYLMKYGGEYVLEENSGVYYANWTYASGTKDKQTEDYEAHTGMALTESGWANISYTYDSGTSDCFSAELDSIGDSISWHVTFFNADNTWSKIFTITLIVVEV